MRLPLPPLPLREGKPAPELSIGWPPPELNLADLVLGADGMNGSYWLIAHQAVSEAFANERRGELEQAPRINEISLKINAPTASMAS